MSYTKINVPKFIEERGVSKSKMFLHFCVPKVVCGGVGGGSANLGHVPKFCIISFFNHPLTTFVKQALF